MPHRPGPSRTASLPAGIEYPLLLAILACLAAWSWRKWPDIVIDFGMQLYIPWRISEGQALYSDIAWKLGPFSQYLNAALFRLFGTSFTTLIWANLVLVALITCLVVRHFGWLCGRATGFLAGLVFLCVFAFGQYAWMGNWNFMSPYAHEATHAVLQSIAVLACAAHALRRQEPRWFAASGACLAAVALTKAEFTLAAGLAVAGGLLLAWASGLLSRAALGKSVAFGAAGFAGTLAAGVLLLVTQMPFTQAVNGIFENWRLIFGSGLGNVTFYRAQAGFDDPAGNLKLLLLATAAWSAVIGAALLADRLTRGLDRSRVALLGTTGVVTFLAARLIPIPWESALRPLPLVCLVVLGGCVLRCTIRRDGEDPPARLAALGAWSLFSLLLLGKILLKTRPVFYGFVHALPATLLFVALLGCVIPSLLRRRGGRGDVFQAAMAGVLAAALVAFLGWSNSYYEKKTFEFGQGGDTIVTYPPNVDARGYALALLAKELAARLGNGRTLLVLPEGVLVNYHLRLVDPAPFLAFQPFDVLTYGGEEAVIAALESRPPDAIALIHRPMPEFGAGNFGSDGNGAQIMDWVRSRYRQVWQFGAEPNVSNDFGVAILERAPGGAATAGSAGEERPARP